MNTENDNNKQLSFSLDPRSGVPIFRQIIDQVTGGVAAGTLIGGYQLPTVRQLAVDLSINPNTVMRAYRELEIRGVLESRQGTGTFVSQQKAVRNDAERRRKLKQLVGDFVARAGSDGFTVAELLEQVLEHLEGSQSDLRTERK